MSKLNKIQESIARLRASRRRDPVKDHLRYLQSESSKYHEFMNLIMKIVESTKDDKWSYDEDISSGPDVLKITYDQKVVCEIKIGSSVTYSYIGTGAKLLSKFESLIERAVDAISYRVGL